MTSRPTIYSIGYSGRNVEEIKAIAEGLGAIVADVRGEPRSRNPQFNRKRLEATLGGRYVWLGGSGLGNRPPKQVVTDAGVRSLLEFDRPLILMCMCHAPGECHRHILIARPLLKLYGVDVRHIYNDIIIRASDLDDESIPEDDLPQDDLSQVIRRGGYDGRRGPEKLAVAPAEASGGPESEPPEVASAEPDPAKSSAGQQAVSYPSEGAQVVKIPMLFGD